MTENESKIIKEVLVIILSHINFNGDLTSFTCSEKKRLKNIREKLIESEWVDDDE